jgi:hypothetical protein
MERLGKQTEGIEQERELTAASRDIRQLMGARNLHIIDVEDVEDSSGPSSRLAACFTLRESLSSFTLSIWRSDGSRWKNTLFKRGARGKPKVARCRALGVFVNEDQGKSPWVLKYDDPKVLAQIDSVFVTIEPKGGSNRPQGRQLMYAYLRANANHP